MIALGSERNQIVEKLEVEYEWELKKTPSQVGTNKDASCQWILLISLSVSLFLSLICSRTHATTPCFVHWLVTLYFIYDFYIWTSLLLHKWSSDLKYGPCPPACNWGSLVSGFLFIKNTLLHSAISWFHVLRLHDIFLPKIYGIVSYCIIL